MTPSEPDSAAVQIAPALGIISPPGTRLPVARRPQKNAQMEGKRLSAATEPQLDPTATTKRAGMMARGASAVSLQRGLANTAQNAFSASWLTRSSPVSNKTFDRESHVLPWPARPAHSGIVGKLADYRRHALLAPWCNRLTRRPLKAKSSGSIPDGATKTLYSQSLTGANSAGFPFGSLRAHKGPLVFSNFASLYRAVQYGTHSV